MEEFCSDRKHKQDLNHVLTQHGEKGEYQFKEFFNRTIPKLNSKHKLVFHTSRLQEKGGVYIFSDF